MIDRLNDLLKGAGLFVYGGFQVGPADDIPLLSDGGPAASVLLIGNAAGVMWQAFEAQADRQRRNPLDSWLRPEIERVAAEVDATSVFPNDGPPLRAGTGLRGPGRAGLPLTHRDHDSPGIRSLACLLRRIAVP